MTKLLLLALCLMSSLSAASYTLIDDRSGLHIATPSLEKRQTAKLRLPNGLEAYLISDPGTHISGAALAVETGSWDDPKERPGMAHFVEHMLFMGTKKYPAEDEYQLYLDTHGGKPNAFTADDRTVYIFSINNSGFREGLDRFAQFFVAPLFNPSGVEREMMAVHQEFCKDVPLDMWRSLHVHKELANCDHPFHCFCIGNQETLGAISPEELRTWYEGHYSSNIMHLVVYSALPIEELKEEVAARFSEVKNRNLTPLRFDLPLLTNQSMGKVVAITPYQDLQTLELCWELPKNCSSNRAAKAEDLLSYILGHEGSESLLTQLKKEELAEGICSGAERAGRGQYLFKLSIQLTSKGVEHYERVIERCFEALAALKVCGIPRYIFDEIQQMQTVRYTYQQREEVFKFVAELATTLVDEPLETFPRCSLMPTSYAPGEIGNLLAALTPHACTYTLLAPPALTRIKPVKQEKWMGVAYAVRQIPQKKLDKWAATPPHKVICCPSPNDFIPKNLALISGEKTETPELLESVATGLLYHADDVRFGVPEVQWNFTIRTPLIRDADPKSHALADLLCHTVSEHLNATAYKADLAGLSYALTPTHNGLKLKLSGYSEKAPDFLRVILQEVKGVQPTLEEFMLYKDLAAREYRNKLTKSPINQGLEVLWGLLYKEYASLQDKEAALGQIHYEDFVAFCRNVTKEAFVEATSYGNVAKEEARLVWQTVQGEIGSAPYPKERHPTIEIATLPAGKDPAFVSKKSTLPSNALIFTIDCGSFSFKSQAALEILSKALETPFFTELRTKQQTGYLVANWSQEIERHLYAFFAVQSSSHDTRDLLARFELFLETSLQNLKTNVITPERFESIRAALIARLEHPAEKISAMGDLYHRLAYEYDGAFDWLDQRIEGLKGLSYEEFLSHSMGFLGKENRRRLAIGINGSPPSDGRLHYRQISSPKRLRGELKYEARL